MALYTTPTLRERLHSHYHKGERTRYPLDLPPTGRLPQSQLHQVHELASRAHAGDAEYRDLLYLSLQPRLVRIGNILKPWPNTPTLIGIWDYDDVEQECYLIFVELLETWDGELPFVPYLLGRFVWRLRDRILRGIGKPRAPRGMIPVPASSMLALLVESDQPEQAAIAREMLQDLVLKLADLFELQVESDSILHLISLVRQLRPDLSSDISGVDAA